jgi:mono/diheme cytochrome c family protein
VLYAITTTGKVTLLIVAGAFIAWALITAIWIPKRNVDFPATLTAFLLISSLFLVAQLGAVYWVTSTQEIEVAEGQEQPDKPSGGPSTTETTPGAEPEAGADEAVVRGKDVFESAGCESCHTLADAGSNGNVGPNLDEAKPAKELVVTRVSQGKGAMPSFKGQLTDQQIQDVATYVSTVAGK